MRLRFTKMHGLGNDFVVIDSVSSNISLNCEKIRKLSDRHFGVGCDQVLIVEPPRSPDADFRYRIFNQDGSEVENCGNGARCFAIFVRDRGLTSRNTIKVETSTGLMTLVINDDQSVTVDMGEPILDPKQIPFIADVYSSSYPIDIDGQNYTVATVSMGNPHAVMLVDNAKTFNVEFLGPKIESHSRFPNRVNAGFLQINARNSGDLRVFERGVGETLACGTGACAAAVAGMNLGLFDQQVEINLPGGALRIEWQGAGHSVFMTGPAKTVFTGQTEV